jgi:hypothetical protein
VLSSLLTECLEHFVVGPSPTVWAAEVTIFYPDLDPGVSATVSIIGAGSDGRTTYAIVPDPTDTVNARECLLVQRSFLPGFLPSIH